MNPLENCEHGFIRESCAKCKAAKAGFSPGPWRVSKSNRNIYDSDGRMITEANLLEPRGFVIVSTSLRGTDREEQANARLIAAAPELLEALETMLTIRKEYWNKSAGSAFIHSQVGLPWPDIQKAEAAIAKAKGQT